MRRSIIGTGILCACLAMPGAGWAESLVGRYQMVTVAGQQVMLFLLDTATGCTWQLGQNPETRRFTFVETDVENLHWTWGGGSQGKIAERIDAANLTEEQKRTLKLELQRTACGWSPMVQAQPPAPPAPAGVLPSAPPVGSPGSRP